MIDNTSLVLICLQGVGKEKRERWTDLLIFSLTRRPAANAKTRRLFISTDSEKPCRRGSSECYRGPNHRFVDQNWQSELHGEEEEEWMWSAQKWEYAYDATLSKNGLASTPGHPTSTCWDQWKNMFSRRSPESWMGVSVNLKAPTKLRIKVQPLNSSSKRMVSLLPPILANWDCRKSKYVCVIIHYKDNIMYRMDSLYNLVIIPTSSSWGQVDQQQLRGVCTPPPSGCLTKRKEI